MQSDKIYSIEQYAEKINVSVDDLKGWSKKHNFSTPRQVYWFYLYTQGVCMNSICGEFNRTHPTIISGINRIKGFIDIKDKVIKPYLEALDIFSY